MKTEARAGTLSEPFDTLSNGADTLTTGPDVDSGPLHKQSARPETLSAPSDTLSNRADTLTTWPDIDSGPPLKHSAAPDSPLHAPDIVAGALARLLSRPEATTRAIPSLTLEGSFVSGAFSSLARAPDKQRTAESSDAEAAESEAHAFLTLAGRRALVVLA
jgi:hypothetical protein